MPRTARHRPLARAALAAAVTLAACAGTAAAALPTDPLAPEQWQLDRIQAPAAWGAPAVAPVTVAVMDTGVDVTHPDLAGAVWTNPQETPGNGVDDDGNGYVDDVHGWDFVNGDGSVFDDAFADSHGTHVAGVVAALHDGEGAVGVAPRARVMVLKFVGQRDGLVTDAIAGFQYAMDNGARVINASFAGPYSDALCVAVTWAAARGVVTVAASGNEGVDIDASPRAPASCPEPSLITVAASDHSDALATFSNHGVTAVDVTAPGEDVLSTAPGASWTAWAGSSMAAPQVAGAAAMLMAAHPQMTPLQVRDAIVGGADRVPALAGLIQSAGRLDVARALGITPSPVPLLAAMAERAAATAPAEEVFDFTGAVARLAVLGRRDVRADRGAIRVRYRLTQDARVAFTVRRAAGGRPVARFIRDGLAGDNLLLLTARAGGARALPPGAYVLCARSAPGTPERRTPFRVVAAPAPLVIPRVGAGAPRRAP